MPRTRLVNGEMIVGLIAPIEKTGVGAPGHHPRRKMVDGPFAGIRQDREAMYALLDTDDMGDVVGVPGKSDPRKYDPGKADEAATASEMGTPEFSSAPKTTRSPVSSSVAMM